MPPFTYSNLRWPRFFGWATVLWVVIFWKLGYPSLLDPDEAHYAQLTREMLRARQWFVPLLDGAPYIDKPIFFHWLQGLSVLALGPTEFAFRLPSALAAVALLATTRWLGAELFSEAIGDWAALMLATVPATFVLASIGMMDMVYVAFLFGAVACLTVAALRQRPPLEYGGYVLLALAVITKGPIALVLAGLLFASALVCCRELREAARRLRWIRGAALILALSAPWFVWMWLTFGRRFVDGYFLAGNLWYFTEPAAFSTRRTDYLFYLRIFATTLFPWSIIALGRLVDMVVLRRSQPMPLAVRMLWLWLFVVIGFFTLARFRLDHYIFPAAPACCVIAARAWVNAVEDRRWRATRVAIGIVAVVLVAGAVIASAMMFRIDLGLDKKALALPLALVAGGGLLAVEMIRRRGAPPPRPTVLALTLLASYAVVVVVGLPVLEGSRPTAPLGRWIAENAPNESVVGSYGLTDWRASIRFYADRRVVELPSLDEVRAFFEQHPDGYVLMRSRHYRALREAGLDVHEVGGLPAIVGRTGKYFRRQVWGRILVVTVSGRTQPPLGPPHT